MISNISIINNNRLVINDLTFKNAKTSAIKTNGELDLNNCMFINNEAQYGGAIYIDNKNISTKIDKCIFDGNKATSYGGAIFSNQGNDVTIQNSVFCNKNYSKSKGSSIASSGNIYISHNLFYTNIGQDIKCEIYVISGILNADNNYFDGSMTAINNRGEAIVGLNYWGYNDIKYNETYKHYTDANNKIIIETANGTTTLNNWLISDYILDYTQPVNGPLHKLVTPVINKYRNRLEKENIVYDNFMNNLYNIQNSKEPIRSKYIIPAYINDITCYIGQEKDLITTDTLTLTIGNEEIEI